jgi:hypothetical protein
MRFGWNNNIAQLTFFLTSCVPLGDVAEEKSSQENGTESLNDTIEIEEKKGRFDWGATITAVLQSKGEISVKKLKKKVCVRFCFVLFCQDQIFFVSFSP